MFEVEIDAHGGTTVSVDGYPQSYVNLDDPELLVFGYVQHLAAVLDSLPVGPLAVTHVGGAAMTLPRYVQHTRPGSPQIVLEPDARADRAGPARAATAARAPDPGPAAAGREGVTALKDASADVVVVDAYADSQVPADLTTLRVVRRGGPGAAARRGGR